MSQRRGNWIPWAIAGAGLYVAARALRRLRPRYEFRGRLVLITGGSRGLGLLMARELATEGARLILVARDAGELERAAEELWDRGAAVSFHVCDMTDRGAVESLARHLISLDQLPDVIINNAGIIAMTPVEAAEFEDFDVAMRTHFYGPMTLLQTFLPALRSRGHGRVINIGSIGGLISIPHLLPYCASKFALVGYSEGLHNELAKDGIVVTTVCPGLMRTGSPRNASFKGDHRNEYAWFKISGSLPVASMNAVRAARQIISACRDGTAFVVLGGPASVAAKLAGVWPNVMSSLLSAANGLLPRWEKGPTSENYRGYQSESTLSTGWWTQLTDDAADRNNET